MYVQFGVVDHLALIVCFISDENGWRAKSAHLRPAYLRCVLAGHTSHVLCIRDSPQNTKIHDKTLKTIVTFQE